MSATPAAQAAAATDRVSELDALRGIAAFAVLVQHARIVMPRWDLPEIPGLGFLAWVALNNSPLRVIEAGRPAVMFFFVLSGFVLTRSLLRHGSPGLAVFAAQRSVRLLLPVAGAILFSAALYALFYDPAVLADPVLARHALFTWEETPGPLMVLRHLLLIGGDKDFSLATPLWSLVHEWRISVFLPLALLFRGRIPLLLLAALLLAALGATRFDEDTMQLGPTVAHSLAGSLYFVLPFGLGAALAMHGPPRLGRAEQLGAGLAVAALFSMKSDAYAYLGSLGLITLAMSPGPFQRFLRAAPLLFLGRVSFSLYLVHVPVLAASLHALHRTLPLAAIALLGMVLSLLAAAVMRAAVEAPAQRLSRRVGRLMGAGAAARPAASDLAPEPRPPAL